MCLGQTENASRTELCRGLRVLAPGAHPGVALSRVVRLLTAPPTSGGIEEANYAATAGASQLIYYWSTIVMRLAFGSFIVAIMVGAFNKVAERELLKGKSRALALPLGYTDASSASSLSRVWAVALYIPTSRAYAMDGATLMQVLQDAIRLVESLDSFESGQRAEQRAEEPIMIGHAELSSLVGPIPARLLMEAFGTRAPEADAHAIESAAPSPCVSPILGFASRLHPGALEENLLELTHGDDLSGSPRLSSRAPSQALADGGASARNYGAAWSARGAADPDSARSAWITLHAAEASNSKQVSQMI